MANANNFKLVFRLPHMNVIMHESQVIREKYSIFTQTVQFSWFLSHYLSCEVFPLFFTTLED